MSDISIDQNPVSVDTDMDRVMLYVRRLVIPVAYAQANKIAATLTLASNHCANLVHEARLDRKSVMAEVDVDQESRVISDRRRGTMPGKFEWRIDVDSEQVLLFMGGHLLKMHFTDAGRLGVQIKANAKIAKAWAGDTSRQWIGVGNLTDAEDNYRRGVSS